MSVYQKLLECLTVEGAFTGSGSGEVEGNVVAVDINLVGDRANSSGCEAADFAGVDLSGPGDIVLVQRGTCNFGDKALHAENAGAEAVVIFNQGNNPGPRGSDRRQRLDPDRRHTDHPRHPGRGRELRRRGRAGAAGVDRVRAGAADRDAA